MTDCGMRRKKATNAALRACGCDACTAKDAANLASRKACAERRKARKAGGEAKAKELRARKLSANLDLIAAGITDPEANDGTENPAKVAPQFGLTLAEAEALRDDVEKRSDMVGAGSFMRLVPFRYDTGKLAEYGKDIRSGDADSTATETRKAYWSQSYSEPRPYGDNGECYVLTHLFCSDYLEERWNPAAVLWIKSGGCATARRSDFIEAIENGVLTRKVAEEMIADAMAQPLFRESCEEHGVDPEEIADCFATWLDMSGHPAGQKPEGRAFCWVKPVGCDPLRPGCGEVRELKANEYLAETEARAAAAVAATW